MARVPQVSLRVIADALRADGVRYRTARTKIGLSEKDAKERLAVCRKWVKRPRAFWSRSVHAYVDNKAWVIPLTPNQRQRFKQTLISGHLRKASEGTMRGCTRPRTQHAWLGVPSVTISAAVAKDRVILWHEHTKRWNGGTAAELYEGPLKKALRRTWGARRFFTIVEDGDRKGNQSGKGIAAKKRAGIRALTLPPRTPSLMPLDFALWKLIEKKVMQTAPSGKETRRLHHLLLD